MTRLYNSDDIISTGGQHARQNNAEPGSCVGPLLGREGKPRSVENVTHLQSRERQDQRYGQGENGRTQAAEISLYVS